MKILITGTPGSGKTTFSSELAKEFNLTHLDLSKYIKKNELYEKYDKKFDTLIFDENVVKDNLTEYLKNKTDFIIDTHSPEVVNFVDFDLIYVLKIATEELYTRLRLRGYSNLKIKENINCEIFETIEDLLNENKMEYTLIGDEYGFLTRDYVKKEIKNLMKKKVEKSN